MDIGIGLPATIPGVTGDQVTEWARRADQAGFPSLGVLDRLVYPNFEPLVTLGAAAAVTERARLTTAILITPYRPNAALLAKQVATVDALSNGRLVLGVAIGGRPDDYEGSGLSTTGRGKILESQLEELKRIWGGEERGFAGAVGPPAVQSGGPPVMVGGHVDASFRRAAKHGDGWMSGGMDPDTYRGAVEKVEAAWKEAGREGKPRKGGLAYFALGDGARDAAQWYLKDYYGIGGEEFAQQVADSAAVDEEMVRQYVAAFADAGCDELILFPCSPDVEQVDLLAKAAL